MNRLSDESLSVVLLSFLRNIEKDDFDTLKDMDEEMPYANEVYEKAESILKKMTVCSKFSISDTIDSIVSNSNRV